MKVWLPYVRGGSGTDMYIRLLAKGLTAVGHQVQMQAFHHNYQYVPWLLRRAPAPAGVDVAVTNSWNGFAFRREDTALVVVEHHSVFDPAYTPYRSFPQAMYHEGLVRRFETWSFAAADAVIAVSQYTADQVAELFPGVTVRAILNGIDTDWFTPAPDPTPRSPGEPFRLLFVGNLTARKGVDLLPKIMGELGPSFHLRYTLGLRTRAAFPNVPYMEPTGRLTDEEMREAYRGADALLFPTRLEGFGYAAAEAMACGTPVVATNGSSLPEVVIDGETGLLCPVDQVGSFVSAIRRLAENTGLHRTLADAGPRWAAQALSLKAMVEQYMALFESLCDKGSDTGERG